MCYTIIKERDTQSTRKEIKTMLKEMMEYGATIKDILKELELTQEEVFGENEE